MSDTEIPLNHQETEAKKSPEKPITRAQRRYQERVQQDAMKVLNSLIQRFYEFFMDNDPESPEVETKKKECIAKWKMYCHTKKLLSQALPLCEENIQKLVDKYKEQFKEA